MQYQKQRFSVTLVLMNLFVLSSHLLHAQTCGISGDGKFAYVIEDKSRLQNQPVLVIESTEGEWKKEIPRAAAPKFAGNDRYFLYQCGDSLILHDLKNHKATVVPNTTNVQTSPDAAHAWLAYGSNKAPEQITLYHLLTKREQRFDHIKSYNFSPKGNTLLLTTENSDGSLSLQWLALDGQNPKTVWTGKAGEKIVKFQFSPDEQRLALMIEKTEKTDNHPDYSIWQYKEGDAAVTELVNNRNLKDFDNLEVAGDGDLVFSPKGTQLLFELKEIKLPQAMLDAEKNAYNKPEVWSYLDGKSYSLQKKDARTLMHYASVVNIENGKISRLENEHQSVVKEGGFTTSFVYEFNDDYVLLLHRDAGFQYTGNKISITYSYDEYHWNRKLATDIILKSLKDGKEIKLMEGMQMTYAGFPYFKLSPDGKYIVYYDPQTLQYYAYNIRSAQCRELTKGIATQWNRFKDGQANSQRSNFAPMGINCWLNAGNGVVIRDGYSDLWKVSLDGSFPHVCLTQDVAKKHGSFFYLDGLLNQDFSSKSEMKPRVYFLGEKSTGYENNGLYSIDIRNGSLKTLVPYDGPNHFNVLDIFTDTKKEHFGFIIQDYNKPPGLFLTKDFKKLQPVTSSNPEQRVGYRKELFTWKTYDGSMCQGTLVYPKDFDSSKQYPVVVNYYSTSQNAPQHIFESTTTDGPWGFTGRGYFVFNPDIHYKVGETAESVVNCVVSGAEQLGQRSYINGKKMGLWSSSFGGFETLCLVAHSHLFAAAIAGCPEGSDLFSYYNTEQNDTQGFSYAMADEHGQPNIGVTPWERPDLYMKSSALFYADRITTPLLLSDFRDDYRCPFSQDAELFNAMRRLGKRVWLLTEEIGGHGDPFGKNGIYMYQFFDHYLKDAPAPVWMTRGIPYRMRGTTDGTEYDKKIKTPGPGLKMDTEIRNTKQEELLQHRTRVNDKGFIEEVKP